MTRPKILIVDNQVIIAQDLIMKVTEMGYSGCYVCTGRDAIEIACNFNPDLILMEVALQADEDGLYTARIIQKLRIIPVLFVTAHPRSTLEEIKDLVLTGYIQKPFCKQELRVSIRELLAAA